MADLTLYACPDCGTLRVLREHQTRPKSYCFACREQEYPDIIEIFFDEADHVSILRAPKEEEDE